MFTFLLGSAPAGTAPGPTPPGASEPSSLATVVQSPPRVVAPSALDFGTVIVGALAKRTLAVSNGATPPADDLIYSLGAPPGFTAPAGSFTAIAGAPANNHDIGMGTYTAGVKGGTLIVSSNDPESPSKPVALSGRVLDHAMASLDSMFTLLADSLDFGYHAPGEFVDGVVRVHNCGYNSLQARLSLSGATITGGDGRFSIVGGFSPVLIGSLSQPYSIHFNDAGATSDSTYSATLTFTSADEPLPGVQAQPPLVVTLVARVQQSTGLCFPSHRDMGDAPEGIPAYSSGVVGRFPTCAAATAAGTREVECGTPGSVPGPTGTVQHLVTSFPAGGRMWLGCKDVPLGVDSEIAGKVNLEGVGSVSVCDPGVGVDCTESAFGMVFGQDECSESLDAGIVGPMQQMTACSTFALTVTATNCAAAGAAFLNVLVDWNEDGDWNDAFRCQNVGCAPEWAVRNFEVVLSSGCNVFVTPAFLAGPRPGEGWMRVTLTDEPVLDDFPWNGSGDVTFRNGETEDYPIRIVPRPPVVISQIYGAGGSTGAVYRNDFIEIFNRGYTAVDLTGWSVQYAQPNLGVWSTTPLAGLIQAGGYYLVQEASSGAFGANLPVPDATGSISMGASSGKLALVRTTGALSGACPSSVGILDVVGFGSSADCFEGAAPTPPPTATKSVFRQSGGCTDSDDNAADFVAAAASPRNSSTAPNSCSPTTPAGVGLANPSWVLAGEMTLLTVAVTPGRNPTSTGLAVTANLSLIGGSTAQEFFDDATHGDLVAGNFTFSFQATVGSSTTPGTKALPVAIADAEARNAVTSIGLVVRSPTSVPASEAASFSLRSLSPNPAARELTAAFSLASDRPARLELVDVAGRIVAAREVGSLGSGLHQVVLREPERLAPGIYLVRLSQSGRAVSGRVVVCH